MSKESVYVLRCRKSWSNESPEHRRMKLPAFNSLKKYIKNQYNLNEESIKIEKRISSSYELLSGKN